LVETFVLIARISFFILPPLDFLGVLGIPAKKKKNQKKDPLNATTSSLRGS
jgi:hypothetical protein